MRDDVVLVSGAGGFIGGALVAALRQQEYKRVRAADIKPPGDWLRVFDDVENLSVDLSVRENCNRVVKGVDHVYNLAGNSAGMGFLYNKNALCMLSVLINTNLLQASQEFGVQRYFFSSSACVYTTRASSGPDAAGLREADACLALPEGGYGWEKLFSERMCRHFREDFGLTTRVARYHNIYGPHCTWYGGRETVIPALCRMVVEAKIGGQTEIEILGTGEQVRSFTFIDDCVVGTQLIMHSEVPEPLNLGSAEKVSIDQLVALIEEIAGVKLQHKYNTAGSRGAIFRGSDNTLIKRYLGWEPSVPLRAGVEKTYAWIYDQVSHKLLDLCEA